MADRNSAIAVFDSGLGGISVLRELVRVLPGENYIYYGDTANAPYGTRSVSEVRSLTFSAYNRLREMDIKAFVLACNTATSAAVSCLRESYPDDIIIGIEPAIKPAVAICDRPTVAVLGTPLTLSEKKLAELMERYADRASIIPVPCPGIVEFVERGELCGEQLETLLRSLLSPLEGKKLDAVVLGCTHYPFIRSEIARIIGEDVPILDGSLGVARQTYRRLDEAGLLRDGGEGSVIYIDSSYPDMIDPDGSMLIKLGGEYLCN